jgi:hypothetical protein
MNKGDEELAADLFLLSQLVEPLLTAGDIWQLEGLVDGRDYREAYEFVQLRLKGREHELIDDGCALMRDVAERLASRKP